MTVLRAGWIAVFALLWSGTALAQTAPTPPPHPASAPTWSANQVGELRHWAQAAPDDALPLPDSRALEAALAAGNAGELDAAATALALDLARKHLLGCTPAAARRGWRIADNDTAIDLPSRLAAALAADRLGDFFAGLRPQVPDYAALRSAHAAEADPVKRASLARNMERWRWLPHVPGHTYLLVNPAAFEVSLRREGQAERRWPVIVGKLSSPTPIFSATVTGVTFNPWWDVPANIVRESVGALVRRNPSLARARGYVVQGGRYRQKPGPANSLGQMKLAMPNPFSVYLHDTPSRNLFARPVRAFSHGCVRVSDALGFAATLLEGARTRAEVDALVTAGATVTEPLAAPIPVYIAYFTAAPGPDGAIAYYPDIYGRDRPAGSASGQAGGCAA